MRKVKTHTTTALTLSKPANIKRGNTGKSPRGTAVGSCKPKVKVHRTKK